MVKGSASRAEDAGFESLSNDKNNNDDDSNDNNNNYNRNDNDDYNVITVIVIKIMALKGANRDFVQSPHCAANCLQHVRSSDQGTVV